MTITVGELVELIDRTSKALAEAGHPDMAVDLCAVVEANGNVRLQTVHRSGETPPEVVQKALSIDPVFEATR